MSNAVPVPSISNTTVAVMAGLVPAIHDCLPWKTWMPRKTWMPGTRPGMTTFCGTKRMNTAGGTR